MRLSKLIFAGQMAFLISGGLQSAPILTESNYDPARVTVTADSDLHFGTFMVFGSGQRTVSPTAAVTDNAIVPLEGSSPSPARFTVTYNRGNQSRRPLDIEIDVYLHSVSRVSIGGIEASLTSLRTDVAGQSQLESGRPIRITIPNCRTRICARSFSVGGTLNVNRSYGGASLTIPIPVYVELVSDDRARR